jgi:hypothetical protein
MSIPPKLEDSVYHIVATMKKKIKNRRVDGKLLSSRIPRGTLTNQQFVLLEEHNNINDNYNNIIIFCVSDVMRKISLHDQSGS